MDGGGNFTPVSGRMRAAGVALLVQFFHRCSKGGCLRLRAQYYALCMDCSEKNSQHMHDFYTQAQTLPGWPRLSRIERCLDPGERSARRDLNNDASRGASSGEEVPALTRRNAGRIQYVDPTDINRFVQG